MIGLQFEGTLSPHLLLSNRVDSNFFLVDNTILQWGVSMLFLSMTCSIYSQS